MSSLRQNLKELVLSNVFCRAVYKKRFERHLRRVLIFHGGECEVYPTDSLDTYAIRKDNRVMILNMKDAAHGGSMAVTFDVFFSAVKPTTRNGLQVVDYSKPKIHTLTNDLQFEFSSFPEEPGSIDEYTARYHPKPGELIFDLGANCGISVYHFSKMTGPTGRVVCFEPDPISLKYLRRNILRYNLENVTVVEAAIGGRDGTAQFNAEGTIASGLADVQARETAGKVLPVPMMCLRTAFEKFGIPNFCKIDIEGAEIEALEAIAEFLPPLKINFVIDTNHKVGGENTDKRVEAIFKSAGYVSETIFQTYPTTYARPAS